MIVAEDYHDWSRQGPLVTDIRCRRCGGRSALVLVDGDFEHRNPWECRKRLKRLSR